MQISCDAIVCEDSGTLHLQADPINFGAASQNLERHSDNDLEIPVTSWRTELFKTSTTWIFLLTKVYFPPSFLK